MSRRTKEQIRIENATEAAFKKHGDGKQIDMFDVGKILDAGHDAGRAGENIEEAVIAAIETYRVN